jgi:hypothetical protein
VRSALRDVGSAAQDLETAVTTTSC